MRKKQAPDPEWVAAAWELVNDSTTSECQYCGGYHYRECPRVKRLVFYEPDAYGNRNVKEVEYWAHGEWPSEDVIFADHLPAED